MEDRTVLDLFRHEVDRPRSAHYRHFWPGGSRALDTGEFVAATTGLRAALAELGIGRGDRVMLLSENRPEWHVVDLAVASLGAVSVPIYGTLTPPQIAYQATDSGAVAAIADTPEQMQKFLQIRESCPGLRHLIQIEGERAEGVLDLAELAATSRGTDAEAAFWDGAARVEPDDLLTIIYTSGTTGEPKGVMLTHDNLVSNVKASQKRAQLTADDYGLEFLPLCHVFERMVGYLYMNASCSVAYCSVHHVGDLIADIAPTVFASVPRFYEKVHDRIQEKVAAAPALRRTLFNWAMGVGMRAKDLRLAGRSLGPALALQHALADRMVFAKLRAALGGRLNFCISGGAPLPRFLGEFYHAIGIYLVEGYGLTETSPVIAVNGRGAGEIKLGTVGKPVEGVEVRIAEDGEICVRGPNVMKGYWNKPEKTAEVFDEDGFFHTGDIGRLDEDGFLSVTDRKKDLIVTAGGKNVAPQPIENLLKRSVYVDNVVLIGDRRPFIVALISPNQEELERWARERGIEFGSFEELTRHPEVERLYAEHVQSVNAHLARYEQVKKFRVLPLMLSVEGGQLTPTLKVKRRVVEKEYAELIDEMYGA